MHIDINEIIRTVKSHLSKDAILRITDESHQHKGHEGHNPKVGVTHIALNVIWQDFEGLTQIERQRLLNAWLDSFFKQGLHAARYTLKTPDEGTLS